MLPTITDARVIDPDEADWRATLVSKIYRKIQCLTYKAEWEVFTSASSRAKTEFNRASTAEEGDFSLALRFCRLKREGYAPFENHLTWSLLTMEQRRMPGGTTTHVTSPSTLSILIQLQYWCNDIHFVTSVPSLSDTNGRDWWSRHLCDAFLRYFKIGQDACNSPVNWLIRWRSDYVLFYYHKLDWIRSSGTSPVKLILRRVLQF